MNVAFTGLPPGAGLGRALLRPLAVAVQVAALLVAILVLEIPIPLWPLACGVAMLALAQAATYALLLPWSGRDAREQDLLRLATLAADAAHEMGTPLSTMAVIVDDLRRSDTPPPDWKESVEVLWQEIRACTCSQSGLAKAAEASKQGCRRDRENPGGA